MSALVVDTSSWIAWLAGGGSSLVDEALEEGRLHLPVLVAAELLSGRLAAAERAELQDMLTDLPAVGTEAPVDEVTPCDFPLLLANHLD